MYITIILLMCICYYFERGINTLRINNRKVQTVEKKKRRLMNNELFHSHLAAVCHNWISTYVRDFFIVVRGTPFYGNTTITSNVQRSLAQTID